MLSLFRESVSLDWRDRGPKQPQRAWLIVQFYGEQLHPEHIGWPAIDGLCQHLRRKNATTATIRAYLSALKVMLSRAQRLGWIAELPAFPEGRTLPLPEPRDLVLRDRWLDVLQALLVGHDHDLFVFLRWTGCRLNEGLGIQWTEVQPESSKVQFINTKGKKSRVIPINDHVSNMLVLRKRFGTTGSVFEQVKEVTFRKTYLKARDQVCEQLGLGDDVRSKWVIHTLRHTRLTELASQGWSGAQLMAFAGHSSMAVSEKYIHSSAIRFPDFHD